MANHNHDSRASKDPHADPGSETVISPRSKVPISVMISAISLAILGTGYFASLKYDIADMKRHMSQDWMLQEQRLWAGRVAKMNPTIQVPDPDEIYATTHKNTATP